MLLIFYFFLWLKRITASLSAEVANPNKQIVIEELVTILNQIRSEKNLSYDQNLFYDDLIRKCHVIDAYHLNLMSKINQLKMFIKTEYDRRMSPPIGIQLSESSTIILKLNILSDDIAELQEKNDEVISEVNDMLLDYIDISIFDSSEVERVKTVLKNIQNVVSNERYILGETYSQFADVI